MVDLDEIDYAQASANYVDVFLTEGRRVTIRESMHEFVDTLAPHAIRVHRSYAVLGRKIRRVLFQGGRGGTIQLVSGARVPLAFGRRNAVASWIEKQARVLG